VTQSSSAASASDVPPQPRRRVNSPLPAWLRHTVGHNGQHRWLVDSVFGIGMMLTIGFPFTTRADWSYFFNWASVPVWLLFTAACVIRRISPWASFVLVTIGFCIKLLLGLRPHGMEVAILIVLYTGAVWGSRTLFYLTAVASVVYPVVQSAYIATFPQDMPFITIFAGDGIVSLDRIIVNFSIVAVPLTLFAMISWVAGALQRMQISTSRSAHSAQIAELEYQRAQEQLVVEQERSQIARDMHDVVAHSLAVVVAQADGGRYLMKSSPQAVEPVLATISETARDALLDVRGLLSQLRHPQAETERKTLDDLPPLIGRIRAAGLNLQTNMQGEPHPVGANAEVAIYRLVQESLTNALKYGDGRFPTRLQTQWGEQLEITVRNRVSRKPKSQSGSRHGLVGMRERLAVVGGTVAAGPQGEDWVVTATVPYSDRSRAAATPGLPNLQNEDVGGTT